MRNRLIRSHRARPAIRRYAGRRHMLPARLRASKPIMAYGTGLDINDIRFVVTHEEWRDDVRSSREDTLNEGDVLSYSDLVDYAKGMADGIGGYCDIYASPENDYIELEIRVPDYENEYDEDAYEIDPVAERVVFRCEVSGCDSLAERLGDAVR